MRSRPKPRLPWVLAILGLIVLAAHWGTNPKVFWDGATQLPIRIRVTDNSTDNPVSGATVTLMHANDFANAKHLDHATATKMPQHSRHLATTDERGEATVMGQFGAGGSSGFFGRTGAFNAEGVLKISHPKYHTTEGLLQNYLQRKTFPIGTKNLDVRIALLLK